MYCKNCGNKVDDGKKFCPNCGKSLKKTESPAQTQPIAPQGVQGTAAPPPFEPSDAAVAGAATPVKTSHKWVLITAAVVVGLLVVAGVAVGLVLLFSSGGSGSKAEILKVEIQDEDGDEVDVDEVPVGKELILHIEYTAQFSEDGDGIMNLKMTDSRDKNLIKKKVTLESSKDPQDYDYDFEIPDTSSGLKAKVEVSVGVEVKGKDEDDDEKMTVKMEGEPVEETTGQNESADMAAARQAAADRIQAANNAVAELAGLGISTEGLIELLEKANYLLANGTTPEELVGTNESAAFFAEYVINECNTRKGVAEEQARQQQPRPDEREWTLCPTCGGEGLVYWEEPEYYWETCAYCYGSGVIEVGGAWVTCDYCGGEGGYWVEIMANVADTCPTCGGTGWVLSMIDGKLVLANYHPHENKLYIVPLML